MEPDKKKKKLTLQDLKEIMNSTDGLSPPSVNSNERNEGTKGSNNDG
jgi:hypothetical protein